MPRGPRQRSETGIYHVMLRGVNRQNIFFDEQDRKHYLASLKKAKGELNFILYAFCLMTNHVHLVLKEMNEPLERTIRRIGVSHAGFINWKYDRVGHLFQGRYRSETIESEAKLLACVRYVHNNPVKAGMVRTPQEYCWSSYATYLQKQEPQSLVDTDYMLELFSNKTDVAKNEFIKFSNLNESDSFLDIRERQDKTQRLDRIHQCIRQVLDKYNIKRENLRELNTRSRSRIINEIRQNSEVSVQELAELLNVSIYMIYRA